MIIFYDESNGHIVGTIDARVHHDGHLNMFMSPGGDHGLIARSIIGFTEKVVGEGDEAKSLRIGHNMHLWNHYLEFEDPKNPKIAINHKVIKQGGKVIGFTKK